METAKDAMPIGEFRLQCEKQITTGIYKENAKDGSTMDLVQERIRQDEKHLLQPFMLMVHKPNYALLASYNRSHYNADPFREEFNDPNLSLDDVEAKFQISLRDSVLIRISVIKLPLILKPVLFQNFVFSRLRFTKGA
ncbi:MAG TPA: hypothetical protein EYH19_00720 [Desulfocapsa sulfexigens]|nr:hypothetical protein [Desulfocapsa sulfexigens]